VTLFLLGGVWAWRAKAFCYLADFLMAFFVTFFADFLTAFFKAFFGALLAALRTVSPNECNAGSSVVNDAVSPPVVYRHQAAA
jgi:hypothetical protein